MPSDYFLQNRAHQLAKLCQGKSPICGLPPARARGKLPKEAQELFELIEAICADANQEGELSETQRNRIESFERAVVRWRFSKLPEVKSQAVRVIKAIFGDAEYFSGLKPLPQYTDAFAYEFLFPSWLNLLAACMLPRTGDVKPRLEGLRQGVLFEFLGKVHGRSLDCEAQLIGYLTLIASRFDAPQCEALLQRCAELFQLQGCELIDQLESIHDASRDAKQFKQWLQDYLTVQYSLHKWPAKSGFAIAYRRPAVRVLPQPLVNRLKALSTTQDWQNYFPLARRLRHLIDSEELLSGDFVSALDRLPDHVDALLAMVVQAEDESGHAGILCTEGQLCLSKLVACLVRQDGDAQVPIDWIQLRKVAWEIAPRLQGYSDETVDQFCRSLIEDAAGRAALLECVGGNEARRALTDKLLERAQRVEDGQRFLKLLACVTVVSPDAECLQARPALQAIEAVVQNRSIGNREFADLVDDLQENAELAIGYLATPILAAGQKPPRLAALYMTLNEISETYAASGKADNFSVVRAKYARLTNFEIE